MTCDNIAEGKFTSTVKKFFNGDDLASWASQFGAEDGDILLVFSGPNTHHKTQECVGKMRHLMGTRFGLRSEGYAGLWVVDFPFSSGMKTREGTTRCTTRLPRPRRKTITCSKKAPMASMIPKKVGKARANAYDMVINGTEAGGGSIRIFDKELQHKVFELLGFTREEAQEQFGFLLGAFEYGAPPHGGLAFGLDRLCTLIGAGMGLADSSIRDYIAFPKTTKAAIR